MLHFETPCTCSIFESATFRNILETHTYNIYKYLYSYDTTNLSISERIKNVRLVNRLSQKQFGKSINKALTTIANYESGYRKPSKEILDSIISIYQLDKNYFK